MGSKCISGIPSHRTALRGFHSPITAYFTDSRFRSDAPKPVYPLPLPPPPGHRPRVRVITVATVALLLVVAAIWTARDHATRDGQREEMLCTKLFMCRTYASARQQCAAIGDTQPCIESKMEGYDVSLVGQCSDNGELKDRSTNVPNIIECIFRKLH